jgi:hypothetical protein
LQNVHRAFDVIDRDHSGEVDRHEVRPRRPLLVSVVLRQKSSLWRGACRVQLAELCVELGHQMTAEEIAQMMAAMDKTGSNTVTREGALPSAYTQSRVPCDLPLPGAFCAQSSQYGGWMRRPTESTLATSTPTP